MRLSIRLWLCVLSLVPQTARADVCDAHGALEAPTVQVLSLLAQRLGGGPATTWTLSSATAFAQAHLARPIHQERLSPVAMAGYARVFAALSSNDVAALHADLAAIGFCDAVAPARRSFDFVVLNGSTAPTVRRRIYAVAKAIESGTLVLSEATQIIFLDGERPRFASETDAVLLDPAPYVREPAWTAPNPLPSDERAIDEMLWQQMRVPVALRRQGIMFVHAQKPDGAARAHTADCVQTWVRRHHPHDANVLVVSDNPFVEYQRRVTEVLLHQSGATNIQVSALGLAADLQSHTPATRLGLLLDALAGTLQRARQQQQLSLLSPVP